MVAYPDFTGATCKAMDTEMFFDWQHPAASDNYRFLRDTCAECPVVDKCAEWSLHHEPHGFWAGMTQNERRIKRIELGIQLDEPADDAAVVGREGGKRFARRNQQ